MSGRWGKLALDSGESTGTYYVTITYNRGEPTSHGPYRDVTESEAKEKARKSADSGRGIRSVSATRQPTGDAGPNVGKMGTFAPSREDFNKFLRGQRRARRRQDKKAIASGNLGKEMYAKLAGGAAAAHPDFHSGFSDNDLRDWAGDKTRKARRRRGRYPA